MNITIDLPVLIARAKQQSGQTGLEMSKEMHIAAARISEWAKGKGEPTADQIAYLADKAHLPIIDTVAALRPAWAHIWKRAAENVRNL